MPPLTPAKVRAALEKGEAAPIYLLESDDAPSRLELAQAFLSLVDEGLQAFNVGVFHGRDATNGDAREAMLSQILVTARTLPMMSPRRVILLHDADALLAPKRVKDDEAPEPAAGGKKRVRSVTPAEEFEAYVAAPEPLTTLVIDAPSLDRGRRITKLLLQHAALVDCGTLDSVEDAARWLQGRLDQDEMRMDAPAVRALIEATGLSLSRLRAEVDKLVLYATGGAITAQDVRDVVAPVEEPGEDFALGKAIWAGNTAGALRELGVALDGGAPPFMLLGQIRAAVIRLRPDSRARQALRGVLEADLAVKTSRGEPRYVLEKLLVEVCAGAPGAPGGGARRSWS